MPTRTETPDTSASSFRLPAAATPLVPETLVRDRAVAVRIATEGGALLRGYFQRPQRLAIEHKGRIDLVTEADKAGEAFIRKALAEATPDYAIMGEEEGGTFATDRPTWVVDPLDGTTNFAHRHPYFSVSIGLVVPGLDGHPTPVVGCVHAPMFGETFSAAHGQGATLNGEALYVSPVVTLGDSLLCTGFPYAQNKRLHEETVNAFARFLTETHAVRRAGSAALDLSHVAAGRFDGFFEVGIRPWDVAAGLVIVAEAGGAVSDYRGGPPRLDGRHFVASNGAIHPGMLAVLAETHRDLDWLP